MNFRHYEGDGEVLFEISISDEELVGLNLRPWEKTIVRNGENGSSIADKVQALEVVVRKIEDKWRKTKPMSIGKGGIVRGTGTEIGPAQLPTT